MISVLSLEVTPSHQVLPTEAPDFVEQRQSIPDVPCGNTTESVNVIKW